MQNCKKIKAFSLIEISIALVIIGLLTGAVLKGKHLLDSAQLNALLAQINQYKLAINHFTEQYGALPGDYSEASSNIDTALTNGDGNGIVNGDETKNFWQHLHAAKLIPQPNYLSHLPQTKMGGVAKIQYFPADGHCLVISTTENKGIITPKQARALLKKIGENNPSSGSIRIKNGNGQRCIKEDSSYDITNKQKTCVIYVQID